ncbi:hypothetical protein [Saguinine gammaherpesvirus 1]|uniref:Uncharacterized protein n=1 Tax=Saguinine gammaherpesvirus 1 TaxID=2169901 RepID=A0A9Q8VIS5_9GAMA|nr:hypothetical protein [Saguinine gammaherpesvirus 1]
MNSTGVAFSLTMQPLQEHPAVMSVIVLSIMILIAIGGLMIYRCGLIMYIIYTYYSSIRKIHRRRYRDEDCESATELLEQTQETQ